jgi:hypothetical protein
MSLYNYGAWDMAGEIKAKVTSENYPQVRAICGGGLPEKFETFEYEQQRGSHGTIDNSPLPPEIINIDLGELREHVKKTGSVGDTALRTYVEQKYQRQRQAGLRE